MMKHTLTNYKLIFLLICFWVISYISILLVPTLIEPLMTRTSDSDQPLFLGSLIASLPVFVLAILFSIVGMLYTKGAVYGVTEVIKFSFIYYFFHYLVLISGLLVLGAIEYDSTIAFLITMGMVFLAGFFFVLLIQPILRFKLGVKSAFLVGLVTAASMPILVSYNLSWFWRFSVMGVITSVILVYNLTRR